jgi:hypothetical protein
MQRLYDSEIKRAGLLVLSLDGGQRPRLLSASAYRSVKCPGRARQASVQYLVTCGPPARQVVACAAWSAPVSDLSKGVANDLGTAVRCTGRIRRR